MTSATENVHSREHVLLSVLIGLVIREQVIGVSGRTVSKTFQIGPLTHALQADYKIIYKIGLNNNVAMYS